MMYVCLFNLFFLTRSLAEQLDGSCINETECKYQCHCDRSCTKNDGQCPPESKCKKGWFGLKCQHQDLMADTDVDVKVSPKQTIIPLTDHNDDTCLTNVTSVIITWKRQYPLTWVRLVVKSIMLYSSYGVPNIDACKMQKLYVVNNRTLDIRCLNKVTASSIKIEGNFSHLCSISISGGRNFAYKRKAELSSTYEYFSGDKAVDGNASSNFSFKSCAHSGIHEILPNLTITLQSPVLIHRVKLYNRANLQDRLKSFRLELFDINKQNIFNYQDTSKVSQEVYQEVIQIELVKTIVVTATQIAYTIDTLPVLTICELEAYGECPLGKWGLACVNECPLQCKSYCHVDDGSCNVICAGFSDPPTCVTECSKGTWGINCQEPCSRNCFNYSCDGQTGHCDQGCVGSTDPPLCLTRCSKGYYGVNCSRSCPVLCLNQTCDPISGHCFGCLDKFQGDFCDIPSKCDDQDKTSIGLGLVVGWAVTVLIFVVFIVVYLRQRRQIAQLLSQHKDHIYNKPIAVNKENNTYEDLSPDVLLNEKTTENIDINVYQNSENVYNDMEENK